MNKRTFRLHVRRAAVEVRVAQGLVLTVLLTAVLWHREQVSAAVCADTLRLHILANSDTVEDQLLKLKVRDAVLQEMPDILAEAENKADAVAAVRTAQRRLQKTAEDALRREGSGQTVAVRLEQAEFDAKDYGSFRLPGGTYTALRIELGEAEGHNWFCVLYPELCIGSSEAEYEDDAENALVFGGYEVRFALLDGAKKLAEAVCGIG
ncbi:stage II sporulation protein R [uncultured Gemmiger sp.]|uniref:stage II sporulation protein R n=1 Tax=uncultured Gemmiger sp. TaxID=1623490 RepID=UPI0025CFDEE8|nr:stage II sporulation protein R [uncultured Gemmiger sp.]